MNRTVREALGEVDVVVLVIDATRVTSATRRCCALLPETVPA